MSGHDRNDRRAGRDGHVPGTRRPRDQDRRRWLAAAVGTLAAALAQPVLAPAALASGKGAPPRNFRLPPLTIQGRDRFSYVRLVAELVVRDGPTAVQDVERVNQLRPRIIGHLVENLSIEESGSGSGGNIVSTEEAKRLKAVIRDLANTAIGEPLIEDVLIISLLVT